MKIRVNEFSSPVINVRLGNGVRAVAEEKGVVGNEFDNTLKKLEIQTFFTIVVVKLTKQRKKFLLIPVFAYNFVARRNGKSLTLWSFSIKVTLYP